jgi:hypothetical protein
MPVRLPLSLLALPSPAVPPEPEAISHAGECSGMTPEPTVQEQTTNKSDDSAADGVQGDHGDQQEREHHQGCAALPVAVSAGDHNLGKAD